ncbi:hypothetical protein ACFL7M_05155 [Thermodesulfobacteriota bacterium]
MEVKEHEKRFGVIALGKGFITLAQLIEAMKTQVTEDMEKGKHRLIGQILIENNVMNTSQVREVLDLVDSA